MKKNTTSRNRGITLVYTLVIMTALCMILSLAVDYGHAQLVKTELRRTADASARAAAAYIYTDLNAATAAALDMASRNKVDGASTNLIAAQDIEYGYWDVNLKTFTKTSSSSAINAVHVTARKIQARGNAVPMMFASVMGRSFCDVQAETIVMAIKPLNVDQDVPATANPFLAGMPAGSVASPINLENTPNYAGTASNPLNSPLAVNMPITDGGAYTFDSISGTASHNPSLDQTNPDGDTGEQIGHNNVSRTFENNYGPTMYNENGIADAWVPINALVGIFLDDKQPNMSAAPANLDFRDPSNPAHGTTDFDTLKPQLKQIFFIGDGLNKNGKVQNFVAPKGATRLFLATMDYYNWANNLGHRQIKVNRPGQIITVK